MSIQFLAKQPILDKASEVIGYELLYRDSEENAFPPGLTDEQASARMFYETALFHGINNVTEQRKAFVNLCDKSVLKQLPNLIPRENLIVEIVERSLIDNETIEAIADLHQQGYVFALDDYDFDEKWAGLASYVSYVKFDIPEDNALIAPTVARIKATFPNVKLVAERIETKIQADFAFECGVDYLQGYYFARPVIMKFNNIDPSKTVAMELVSCLTQGLLDFDKVSKILSRDISLTARVIKLANVSLAFRNLNISSINKAVVYLGEDTMRKFISVVAVTKLASDKPDEIVLLGLRRALFIQNLPTLIGQKPTPTGFLVGLLSVLDAILDCTIEDVIEKLQLQEKMANSMLHYEGQYGCALELVKHVEKAEWKEVTLLLKNKFPDQSFDIDGLYVDVYKEARDLLS
ncbi:EAL and HDOD domain-containing protein [Psychrosphaera haliotis]|uniref:HDOD domain-containing protein n=1 Tax=Psychrosphaera haliotis TaxID=555083 RepID=A0A6N8F3L1_9GAMM|nr:HDOD domain-containing protein [Psychrosphaera haliotis]MUH71185.1 HDOD domain-containing protein [Psychrosphaera haliotis]